jgi:hypothetical protein
MGIDTGQMPILEVSGCATLKEYTEANRVLLLNTTTARKVRYLLYQRYGYVIGGVLFAIGIAMFYATGISQATGAASSGLWGGQAGWVGPLLAGIGGYWLCLPSAYHRRVRRLYDQADMGRECIARLDEEGVYSARLDGTAESRIKWEAFQYWRESRGLFVLFPSKAQYFWISKRLLKPGDEDKLRGLLAAKITVRRRV